MTEFLNEQCQRRIGELFQVRTNVQTELGHQNEHAHGKNTGSALHFGQLQNLEVGVADDAADDQGIEQRQENDKIKTLHADRFCDDHDQKRRIPHLRDIGFFREQVRIALRNCGQMEYASQEAYIARTRREFHQLISEERMYYYFQPIFSAQTGRVHAYEALMRSDLPTLRSPATIMKLAREQGALYEIERLTFRKALEEFDNLRSKNLVDRQALIFINSIASVCLRREDSEYMDQRWHELRRQMVIEITEEEEMNRQALESKRHAPGFSGMFALDDYGSGYSNEGSLLELAPRFIKVDISIIRGIDSDPDKQQILRNVVRYAQPRSMQIIAEGVETAAEMRTVIDLGADLLQGYFLARPAAVPDPIAPEAAEIIRAI